MTVVESPKGRASHNLGNRGAIPPFPPPGYCYIFFQNLSRKESSSPPAPSLFRLILRLEKTGRRARGLLRRYLEKMTGRSRAQVTRLIARYQAQGTVEAVSYRRHRFAQRYTRADIELLAAVDEAHDTLSGPATRRILQREYQQYGKPEYERLASISVAHLYNLRRQQRYRERRLTYDKT